ncbi:MAG: hypothetical protein JWM53_1043, partial [bacterium]|nr:hypothetical protein [bacterium]
AGAREGRSRGRDSGRRRARRVVVDDDDLGDAAVRLLEEAVETGRQRRRTPVGADDDGDVSHANVSTISTPGRADARAATVVTAPTYSTQKMLLCTASALSVKFDAIVKTR